MKHLLTSFLLLCCFTLCSAQATFLTIDNQTPGWLSSKIGYGDQQTLQSLTITGYLNAADLKFIGSLINSHNLTGHINIEDCQIIESDGSISNTIENNCFGVTYSPDKVIISKITLPKNLVSATKCLSNYMIVDTLVMGGYSMPSITTENFGCYDNIKHLLFREGVEAIGRYTFSRTNKSNANYSRDYEQAIASDVIRNEMPILESVVFPTTITSIAEGAFDWCIFLKNMNLPNSIEEIGKFAFSMTGFRPDTLLLPTSLIQYNTTSFTLTDNQTLFIPESVSNINNTYSTYNNTMNTWTTHDYIESSKHYNWVMENIAPPSVTYSYSGFLRGSTVYIPKDSYATYSKREPFSTANLIEVVPVEAVVLSMKSINLKIGEKQRLGATILPANADDITVIWSSEDSSIVKVSDDGVIEAISPGTAKVYAISNENTELKDSCVVTVYQPTSGIRITPSKANLMIGESTKLVAEVQPEDATSKQVKWSSTNPQICYVNNSGTVTALSPGLAIITATTEDGKYTAECLIFSNAYIDNKTIQSTLEVGSSLTLSVVDDNTIETSINWTSSNPEVAAVDSEGTVWFNAAGSATVTAECQGHNFSVPFMVREVMARALNVFPVEAVGGIGHEFSLLALHEPENTTDKSVTWESSDPEVATVDADGRVSLAALGTAKITARSGEHTAECAVTVDDVVSLTEMATTGVVIDIVEDGIVVRNAPIGEMIAVYAVDGKAVNGAVVESEETRLKLATGIYIVKVSPATVAKVLIK